MIDLPWLPSMAALALAARAEMAQDRLSQASTPLDIPWQEKCQHGPAQHARRAFKCSVAEKSFDKHLGET